MEDDMSNGKELVNSNEELKDSGKVMRQIAPLVDIFENDDEILLHADMPGVAKENISINIEGGKLRLEGSRTLPKKGALSWEEFGDIKYLRTFSVPGTINIDKVNAELRDGVLQLHLPKSEAAKPRQIEIRTA
jgi:HSP20 family molecular chaperone IbpA